MSLEALRQFGAATGFGQQTVALEKQSKMAAAPHEMSLKERVMTHEQRITQLEGEIAIFRDALKELAEQCAFQLGLEIR